jgi:hypothetical protein
VKLIYVAGPYTGPDSQAVAENVRRASLVGQELLRRGWAVICPHSMTYEWDIGTGLDPDVFYQSDLEMLRRCDAICMVGDWTHSKGAMMEWRQAMDDELELYVTIDEVPRADA